MADPIPFNFGAGTESTPAPTGPPASPEKPKETSVFSQAEAGFHEQLGKAFHAAKNVESGVVDNAINLYRKYTGKGHTDSKNDVTNFLNEIEEHQKQAAAQAGPPQSGLQGFARGVGAAPVEMGEWVAGLGATSLMKIPAIRRPAAAWALVKAAENMDKGVAATARSAVGGFAEGKSMEAFDKLPFKPRVAANTISGAAGALISGEGARGAVTQGLAQGALSTIGLPGKSENKKLSIWERKDMVTQSATPFLKDIQKNFGGETVSKEAGVAAGNIRENAAIQDMSIKRATDDLENARKFFAYQPRDVGDQFYYGFQKGAVPPGMEDFAKASKSVFDDMWDDLHERGLIYTYLENYLPSVYKDPEAAKKMLAGIRPNGTGTGNTGPFRGARSFKYQRKYANAEIANHTAGLELRHDNPVDNMMVGLMQGRKAIMAHDIMKEAEQSGQGMWVRFGKGGYRARLPADRKHWDTSKRPDDPTFIKYAAPPKKGTPGQGAPGKKEVARWFADPDVMNLIDNHVAPGLRAVPVVGPIFNGVRAYGNFENGLHFGLSGRHAITEANNSMGEAFARGYQELFKGNLKGAGKEFALGSTIAGPGVRDYVKGRKTESFLLKDRSPIGSQGPRTVENMFIMGGGRLGRDRIYNTDLGQKFRQLWGQGKVLRASAIAPLVPLEKMSNVIMKDVVPKMKTGAAMHRMQLKMAEMGPNATRDDMRREAARITKHIDNIMGEIVWDNRFTPRVVRDSLGALFQAPGWNVGSASLAWNTVSDVIKQGPLKALQDSPSVSYVLGLLTAQAFIGAVTQMMLGQGFPKSFHDFMHPRDGSTAPDGNPGRIHTPNYISNDSYGWYHDPVGTATNKLHSLITQVYEFSRNKDWQGKAIRRPEHSGWEQLGDVAKWYTKQSSPYAVRQILDAQDASGETSAKDIALPMVGINKSPLWIGQSPAERLGSDFMRNRGGGFNTSEEREEAYKKERQISGKMRQGKDVSAEIGKEVQEGNLGKRDISNILRSGNRKHIEILINRSGIDEAFAMYQAGSPQEKELMRPYIYRKLKALKADSAKERERILRKFNEIVVGEKDSGNVLPASEGNFTQPPPSRDIPFNFSAGQ